MGKMREQSKENLATMRGSCSLGRAATGATSSRWRRRWRRRWGAGRRRGPRWSTFWGGARRTWCGRASLVVQNLHSDQSVDFKCCWRKRNFCIFLVFDLRAIDIEQGNYSLRRPPKLIMPQAVIEQRWFADSCLIKQSKKWPARTQIWHLYVWPL